MSKLEDRFFNWFENTRAARAMYRIQDRLDDAVSGNFVIGVHRQADRLAATTEIPAEARSFRSNGAMVVGRFVDFSGSNKPKVVSGLVERAERSVTHSERVLAPFLGVLITGSHSASDKLTARDTLRGIINDRPQLAAHLVTNADFISMLESKVKPPLNNDPKWEASADAYDALTQLAAFDMGRATRSGGRDLGPDAKNLAKSSAVRLNHLFEKTDWTAISAEEWVQAEYQVDDLKVGPLLARCREVIAAGGQSANAEKARPALIPAMRIATQLSQEKFQFGEEVFRMRDHLPRLFLNVLESPPSEPARPLSRNVGSLAIRGLAALHEEGVSSERTPGVLGRVARLGDDTLEKEARELIDVMVKSPLNEQEGVSAELAQSELPPPGDKTRSSISDGNFGHSR